MGHNLISDYTTFFARAGHDQNPPMLNHITKRCGNWHRSSRIFLVVSLIFFSCSAGQLSGQVALPSGKALQTKILAMDSVFWKAYNDCDVEKMMSFIADEVEFYHDKGGQTNGRAALAKSLQAGLCRTGDNEIERRPVAGTIKVFPLAGTGAILSGQHTFHGKASGSDDGIAYFFHLWKFTAGEWKMTRVFSYDHAPLFTNEGEMALSLPAAALEKFVGTYEAPLTGTVKVRVTATGLSLVNGNKSMLLLPKTATVFFNRELPLEFVFEVDENGRATKFSVYEKGQKVEEAIRAGE